MNTLLKTDQEHITKKKKERKKEEEALPQPCHGLSCRPHAMEALVSPCWICQSGTGSGFFPRPSVFPHQYHSTMLIYHLVDKQYANLWWLFGDVSPHQHEQEVPEVFATF
jgi:hypothetical protein